MGKIRERKKVRGERSPWPKAATMERLTGERRGAGSDGGFSRADGGRGGSRDGEHDGVDGETRRGG
uniref:Uncharacterized protein n=1 Tax=Oryza meridionalis TaxID=40149 RepID=A0A0E0FBW5_9ORYZ